MGGSEGGVGKYTEVITQMRDPLPVVDVNLVSNKFCYVMPENPKHNIMKQHICYFNAVT